MHACRGVLAPDFWEITARSARVAGQVGKAKVSDRSTLTSSAAGRYATALFELAQEAGALDEAERDLNALGSAIDESSDLTALISSPIYTRAQQGNAMAAIADAMGLGDLVRNLIGLMASKRRLFVLPELISIFAELMADHRGEITAEVTAARPLSEAQQAALAEKLGAATSKQVKLDIAVDDALIGGLVVKLGSRMIDTSIRSKLAGLQNAMREVR